jgi:uncharacterized protein (DUF58 family)
MLRNKKVRCLVLVSFCFYLIALANDAAPMFVLCWVTLSVLGVAWGLSRLALSGLGVERRVTRPRAFAGDPLPTALRLSNAGSLPKSNVLIQDRWHNETLNLGDEQTYLVQWLGGAERVPAPAAPTAPHRGRYRLGPTRATGSDPLGIFEVQRVLGEETSVIVYPRPVDLPEFRLEQPGRVEADRAFARRPLEDGLDFRGVREYQPGDDLRRVHWKAMAHTGTLYIREFEESWPARATVVVDLHREWQFGHAAESTVECGVGLAASVCRRLLQQGYRLRFLACDAQTVDVTPGEGEAYLYQVLEPLAVVTGVGSVPVERLLQSHLPDFLSGAALVLITASAAPELVEVLASLRRRGVQVLVIALVPHSFGPPAREGRETRDEGRGTRDGKLARWFVGSLVRWFVGSWGRDDETPFQTTAADLEAPHGSFVACLRTAGVTVWPFHRGDDPAVCLRF